jgi:hypothetical protein
VDDEIGQHLQRAELEEAVQVEGVDAGEGVIDAAVRADDPDPGRSRTAGRCRRRR